MPRITEYTRDGLAFDVADTGPEDGTPVVLLHGFPQRATSWQAVAERLNADGFRTFAPDLRGYSPGARPPSRFDYTVDQLSADVLALIGRIGTPVHLVGHDWGAVIAWQVAGDHPDELLSLTAVSVPHPAAFMKAIKTSKQGLKSYYMALFQLPLLPEKLLGNPSLARRFLRGAGMTHDMIDTYLREIVDDGALPGGLGFYRSIPKGGMTGHRVKVPTTYVWSDGDVALGRTGAELCGDYVTAPYTYEVIEGASHWLPDEQPDRLAEIIAAQVRAAS